MASNIWERPRLFTARTYACKRGFTTPAGIGRGIIRSVESSDRGSEIAATRCASKNTRARTSRTSISRLYGGAVALLTGVLAGREVEDLDDMVHALHLLRVRKRVRKPQSRLVLQNCDACVRETRGAEHEGGFATHVRTREERVLTVTYGQPRASRTMIACVRLKNRARTHARTHAARFTRSDGPRARIKR